MDTAEQAKQNFLLRYTGGTRRLYEYDLDIWFGPPLITTGGP